MTQLQFAVATLAASFSGATQCVWIGAHHAHGISPRLFTLAPGSSKVLAFDYSLQVQLSPSPKDYSIPSLAEASSPPLRRLLRYRQYRLFVPALYGTN